MASEMKWKFNSLPKSNGDSEAIFDLESMKAALSFHQSFPGYSPTPLVNLKEMSTHLGLGSLHVKDESYRFGLSAFKALGSSFATARLISTLLDMPLSNLTYDVLTSPEAKERLSSATLVTATDGNHGRGVAWTASQLGIKAIVLMPAGTTRTRFDNIEAEGAKVTIERLSYDECVQKASRIAASIDGAILMQDTAWPGYETIPSYIMQGYSTMVAETFSQLEQEQSPAPTHVFLQAGVGSMAGAVAEYIAKLLPNAVPKIAIVEPFAADCHYISAAREMGSHILFPVRARPPRRGSTAGLPTRLAGTFFVTVRRYFSAWPTV